MRIRNYINGIEGVISGGIATINVPVNRRYHAIKLFVSATGETLASAIVDSVRVIVNGVVMRDLLPAEFQKIAKLNGQTCGDLEIPIFFSEPWRASVIGEESTSWDMFDQVRFTLEVKFKTGLTAPTLQALATYDFARNVSDGKPFLAIMKALKFTYNAPAGNYDITTLPVRFPIHRILLGASTGAVNSVEVFRDSQKVFESTVAENARFLADYKLAAGEFSFPLVFDAEQQISSPLLVDREINVRANCASPNTLTVIVEHRANGYT